MLAELAVKAGYEVLALDYFGDYDLQALCPSVSLLRNFAGKAYSPGALAQAAHSLDAPAVVYGASFENHPELVASLSAGRELIGNPPDVLARVRDPLLLEEALRAGGFAFPRTVPVEADARPEHLPDGVPLLWKPLLTGGGHGVRTWRPGQPIPGRGILQERVPGVVCSAVFAANGEEAVVLGLTEQLVGQRAFGASGFRYCGNLVPPRQAAMLAEARRLASHLARSFGLRGVNGFDFVWNLGRIWTLEVNPRPSAPLELIDSLYNLRTFDLHVRACSGELPDFDLAAAMNSGDHAAGKAILFAGEDVVLGDTSEWPLRGIRDVPHPGERIEAPHPICTLIESGRTPEACLGHLRAKAGEVRSWFVE
jgi:predicted ATP-grasp superfamily ATP-dependent carboligase